MCLTAKLLFPELTFKTSRSGGKGGQNVNKVSTKVELNFDLESSALLTQEQRDLLRLKWSKKITKEGVLQLVSQSERTQLGNKRVVLEKLDELLKVALTKQKVRRETKIPKSIVEKRLSFKKRKAEIKQLRRNKLGD